MKNVRVACLITLVPLVIFGCKKGESEEASASQSTAQVPVEVSIIRQGDINVTIDAFGQTEALHKETVLSPVAGTITAVRVLEGSPVHPGDTLAEILTKESQAAVTGANELLAAATTPEQKSEAERALQLAQRSQNRVSVVAHASGVVSSRAVVGGSLVAEGTELLTIVDPSSVDFVAQVPLRDLTSVGLGEAARVDVTLVNHTIYNAQVAAISPESDPQTQTVRVRLHFEGVTGDQRIFLKDGITGTAHIITSVRTSVFLAPTTALLRNDANDAYSIVTVTSDSLARSIPVSVGVIVDTTAEISGPGLKSGMSVVIAGNYVLPDSTRVTVTNRKNQ